jgi:hypothetical protein
MAYLAQPDQQQQLEWLDGSTLSILLDGEQHPRRHRRHVPVRRS